MTNVHDPDPHDDVLAAAWRSQSDDQPPRALDATILAAAHRAVSSGPRDASVEAREATRPQRWWTPLGAAATIGVVVIGILQVAPQAPVDAIIGERADLAERAPRKMEVPRVAPTADAVPAPERASVASAAPVSPPATSLPVTPPAPAGQKRSTLAESAPAPRAMEPQPFPADVKAKKLESDSAARQGERKDAAEVPRKADADKGAVAGALMAPPPAAPPAVAQRAQAATAPQAPATAFAPAPSTPMAAAAPSTPAPMAAAAPSSPAPMAAPSAPSAVPPGSLGKLEGRMRENNRARDEAKLSGTDSAPAAASSRRAPAELSSAELQQRARDPVAWVAEIRALRNSGRIAEALAQMREFRRLVPDAESRLPADLREWYPRPALP